LRTINDIEKIRPHQPAAAGLINTPPLTPPVIGSRNPNPPDPIEAVGLRRERMKKALQEEE
jgi:hypothetical protein